MGRERVRWGLGLAGGGEVCWKLLQVIHVRDCKRREWKWRIWKRENEQTRWCIAVGSEWQGSCEDSWLSLGPWLDEAIFWGGEVGFDYSTLEMLGLRVLSWYSIHSQWELLSLGDRIQPKRWILCVLIRERADSKYNSLNKVGVYFSLLEQPTGPVCQAALLHSSCRGPGWWGSFASFEYLPSKVAPVFLQFQSMGKGGSGKEHIPYMKFYTHHLCSHCTGEGSHGCA